MSTGIGFWRCSPKLYNKYLLANKIVETDFYLVEDKENDLKELYLGTILLSSSEESIEKIKQLFNRLQPIAFSGLIEDLIQKDDTRIVFDAGNAETILKIMKK